RFSRDWSSDVCSSDLSNSWPLMIRIDVGLQRTRLALAQGEAARALILLNGSPFERPDELPASARLQMMQLRADAFQMMGQPLAEIGRASCRERGGVQV